MKKWFFVRLALAAMGIMPAAAADGVVLLLKNGLDQEIVAVRVRYRTSSDEPKHTSSQVFLPVGGEFRTGAQDAILPERIILDLATKSYDFADLSRLKPAGEMFLEAAYEDGRPLLRRLDNKDGENDNAVAEGRERDYLTDANRPNAIDRRHLTRMKTWEDVCGYMAGTVAENREDTGEAGAAGFLETLFREDAGWGRTLFLPVFWLDYFGAARVQALDKDIPEEGIAFDLRFRLPESDAGKTEEMIDRLHDDLRKEGFRPWYFAMRTQDNEFGEGDVTELIFHEDDSDKSDEQDAMQKSLFAAYADSSLREASATWVNEEASSETQGVLILFSRGIIEAVFIPDGRMLME